MNDQPLQQPPVAPQGSSPRTSVKTAQVFGALSIAFFFVPPIAIGFGITALVMAAKSRKAYKQEGEATNGPTIATVLGAIGTAIATLILIAVTSVIVTFFTQSGSFTGTSMSSDEYSRLVAKVEAQKKTYQVDETIAFGPLDITNTTVTRGYVPTQAEQEILDIPEREIKRNYEVAEPNFEAYGGSKDAERQYVQVRMSVERNDARAAELSGLAYSTGDWSDGLVGLKLNDSLSKLMFINGTRHTSTTSIDYSTAEAIQAGEKTEFAFIYSIPSDSTRGEMSYTIGLFTKVSGFVGTEGMPSELFEYKITLW